jgi:outer membrane protein TolC
MTGCQEPADGVETAIERHRKAVAPLEPLPRPLASVPLQNTAPEAAPETTLPTGVLTLETARAVAVVSNPDVHAAQARVEAAAARIDEALARFYPVVVFTQTYVRTFQTPASRNRLATLLQPQPFLPADVDSSSLAVTALLNAIRRPLFGYGRVTGNTNPFSENSTAFTTSWVVFDGFVREAQVLAAKYIHSASEQSRIDVERLIQNAVDSAYHQVQLAEERLRIARADEEFSREQLEETEKLRQAGRASQSDVDNFRVRMLSAQANVTASEGQRGTGRLVLAELMGLPGGELPADLVLSSLQLETDQEMTAPEAAASVDQALQARPDIRQLEDLVSSREEEVRIAKGLFSPVTTVSGSWGFDHPETLRYGEEDQSSAAAVEFRWELYTGGAREAQLRGAEAMRTESVANLNRLRLSVQSEVRGAVIDVIDAQQQILLQRESLTTAAENRRIVQASYLAGKETLSRLNETQRDYITAEANLALARIRLRQAWSDLNSAISASPMLAEATP